MNSKTIKIISAILTSIMLILSIGSVVLALDPSSLNGADVSGTTKDLEAIGQKIIGILKVVGSIVSVIMLMILGFKYMMGSAEDKADYKKSMIPYIVGAVCIFVAPFIAGAIYDFANGMQE